MAKQNEANGTASEPIARYDELPILQTYKVCFENMVQIGGFWAVGNDKAIYHIEMPDKVKECMWKNAKRYDIQTGKVMGYTNADRLRGMTDEELARLFDDILKYNVVGEPDENVCSDCYKTDCAPCWLNWLKAPVEGENYDG